MMGVADSSKRHPLFGQGRSMLGVGVGVAAVGRVAG